MKAILSSFALVLLSSALLAFSAGCGSISPSAATASQASSGAGTTGSSGSSQGGSGSGSTGGSGGSAGSGSGASGGSTAPSGALALVPASAIAVHDIQALPNWKGTYDTATSGSTGVATGIMNLVTAPSLSGQARSFATTYSNSGGERYSVSFASDPAAANFLYDAWVYVQSPSTGIANIEMDMNQVLANGQTVIYGFQCSGYSGTWEYTTNAGTPQHPSDKWIRSQASCNPRRWTTDSWHHVQISYSRDKSGDVTYKSVWLDDTEQTINATVPSSFALGWGSVLVTNFQVDGLGAHGSATAYLDNLTVYRW
jgi:hypothetical protein